MDRILFDFTAGAAAWESVDDRVMGGESASGLAPGEGCAVFSGLVSLARNGGFASIRSPSGPLAIDGFAGMAVEARGDGKRYGLRLRTSDRFDDVAFQALLVAPTDRLTVVRIPFDAFRPRYRGWEVTDYPPLDPSTVCGLGLLIADRQEGPFRLEVARIGAWRA
ncbi:MAG: CIA30 family protein [Candidatus Krumholzibacteriia bacterium]